MNSAPPPLVSEVSLLGWSSVVWCMTYSRHFALHPSRVQPWALHAALPRHASMEAVSWLYPSVNPPLDLRQQRLGCASVLLDAVRVGLERLLQSLVKRRELAKMRIAPIHGSGRLNGRSQPSARGIALEIRGLRYLVQRPFCRVIAAVESCPTFPW